LSNLYKKKVREPHALLPFSFPISLYALSLLVGVTSVVGTQGGRVYLDEALGLLGCPTLLGLTIFAKLILHEVVLGFYTHGLEAEGTELEGHHTIHVAL
jgi:hypothetical protein